MGYNAAPLEKLIEEFGKFPGIGRKGATRMAYQVLSMSDADAAALASCHPERPHPAPSLPHLPELHRGRALPHLFQRQAGYVHHLRGRDAARCAGL